MGFGGSSPALAFHLAEPTGHGHHLSHPLTAGTYAGAPGQESSGQPPWGFTASNLQPFGCFRPSSSLNEKKDLKFTASIDV